MIQQLAVLLADPYLLTALVTILGLLIGSFLNVVIYRLPIMMQREWEQECRAFLEIESQEIDEPFNLSVPLSRCPFCNTPIKPYQNIPVLSYLLLKGHCAACAHPIAIRYPLVEALTALLSAVVAWHFGDSPQTVFALLLTWVLIGLSFIDLDHQLLPDTMVLPMVWVGLFLSVLGVYTDSFSSIIGAIAGYMTLWLVYQVFKMLTGKDR